MRTCGDCSAPFERQKPAGLRRTYCDDCARRRHRIAERERYARLRGEKYVQQAERVEYHVPIELRRELAGFAKELGFGR